MAKYRKKPVEVEASQWFKNGDHPLDYTKTRVSYGLTNGFDYSPEDCRFLNFEGDVVRYFRRPDVSGQSACKHCGKIMHEHGWIDTLEGGHIVCPGDWIIAGIKNEFYPCKPDVFEKTYDKVE